MSIGWWLVGSYVLGSIVTFYMMRHVLVESAIAHTIEELIKQNYIRTKINRDGEMEILPLEKNDVAQ